MTMQISVLQAWTCLLGLVWVPMLPANQTWLGVWAVAISNVPRL